MLALPMSLAPLGCSEENQLLPSQTQYKHGETSAGLGNGGLFNTPGRVKRGTTSSRLLLLLSSKASPEGDFSPLSLRAPGLWIGDLGHFKNQLAGLVPCGHRTAGVWAWATKPLALLAVTC